MINQMILNFLTNVYRCTLSLSIKTTLWRSNVDRAIHARKTFVGSHYRLYSQESWINNRVPFALTFLPLNNSIKAIINHNLNLSFDAYGPQKLQ